MYVEYLLKFFLQILSLTFFIAKPPPLKGAIKAMFKSYILYYAFIPTV